MYFQTHWRKNTEVLWRPENRRADRSGHFYHSSASISRAVETCIPSGTVLRRKTTKSVWPVTAVLSGPHEDTLGIREVSQEEGVRCWGQCCGPWLFTKEAKLCVRERETWLVAANAEEAPARKTWFSVNITSQSVSKWSWLKLYLQGSICLIRTEGLIWCHQLVLLVFEMDLKATN